MRNLVGIIFIMLFYSCNADKELEFALKSAGENRKELEAVLNYYATNNKDSLKLKAAKFLIKNMPYHFSLEEYYLSPDGNKHRPDISLFKEPEEVSQHCDSLVRSGYRIVRDKVSDICAVDAEFLINNIELAFSVWQKPWAKDISFQDFCRYILPYRAQVEQLSSMRAEIMKRFVPLLDSAKVTSSFDACMLLNEHLKHVMKYKDPGLSFYPTLEETLSAGISRCEGLCNLGTFIMRAAGIPVTVDQTTWVKMDLGHSWCAVLDGGKFHSFGPGEDHPDVHARMFSEVRYRRPAKVYRSLFEPAGPLLITGDDGYVTHLKSPLTYDVTHEYLDAVTDIIVLSDEIDFNHRSASGQVYLCVHNFYEWKPIAIGGRTGLECCFEDVVGDNIFIIADSPDGRMLRFITAPFYVDRHGKTHKFIPDWENTMELTLEKNMSSSEQSHTLKYWDTVGKNFITLPFSQTSDSTQLYDQVPKNALLWFGIPDRIVNQRVFFMKNDSIMRY